MPNTDWNAEFSPWRRTGQTIGDALARRPQYAAQARERDATTAYRNEQMNTERAQQGEIGERTRKVKADADRSEMQLQAARSLGEWFRKNATIDTNGNLVVSGPGVQEVMAGLSEMGESSADASRGIGEFFKTMRAPAEADKNRGNRMDIAKESSRSREAVAGINAGNRMDIAGLNASNRLDIAKIQPKSAGGDVIRDRLAAGLLQQQAKDAGVTNALPLMEQFNQLTGRQPATNAPARQGNPLDKATAAKLLLEAKGDKALARKLAVERGYDF